METIGILPKAKPAARRLVHHDEDIQLPPDVREIMMNDAIMRQDFEEFARWHVIEDEGMVIPDTTVALPVYEVKHIRLPDGAKPFEDWGAIIMTKAWMSPLPISTPSCSGTYRQSPTAGTSQNGSTSL